jgi:hypothetical protein
MQAEEKESDNQKRPPITAVQTVALTPQEIKLCESTIEKLRSLQGAKPRTEVILEIWIYF